jgi:hypothetical protein
MIKMAPVTRSQTKQKEYAVTIDFDGASKAWRANKMTLKNGCFAYKKPVVQRYNLRSLVEPSGCLAYNYEAAY